jgi:predicted phage tail protein
MKLPALPTNMAGMDCLAILQALFGIGYVISHLLSGDTGADVWLTGYSMAFGGVSTKLAYETVNPKLSRPGQRPGQPRVNLIDTLTRR